MGRRISRLYNGLISYVLFVLTSCMPVAEESLSCMRHKPAQAYYIFITFFYGGVVRVPIIQEGRHFLVIFLITLGYPDSWMG